MATYAEKKEEVNPDLYTQHIPQLRAPAHQY
jgi:hypothetical protein